MSDEKFKCERLWSAKELVKRTALFGSIKRLYLIHMKIGIPHYKLGGKLWFDPVELDEFIQKHRRTIDSSAKRKTVRLLKR